MGKTFTLELFILGQHAVPSLPNDDTQINLVTPPPQTHTKKPMEVALRLWPEASVLNKRFTIYTSETIKARSFLKTFFKTG
jgi:hypothetical protein